MIVDLLESEPHSSATSFQANKRFSSRIVFYLEYPIALSTENMFSMMLPPPHLSHT